MHNKTYGEPTVFDAHSEPGGDYESEAAALTLDSENRSDLLRSIGKPVWTYADGAPPPRFTALRVTITKVAGNPYCHGRVKCRMAWEPSNAIPQYAPGDPVEGDPDPRYDIPRAGGRGARVRFVTCAADPAVPVP